MVRTHLMQALVAGFFFALWPLLIKESRISAYTSPFMMSAIVAAFSLPFALFMGLSEHKAVIRWTFSAMIFLGLIAVIMSFPKAFESRVQGFNLDVRWLFVASAALASAFGLMLCNSMIVKAPRVELGALIGIMTVVQFTVTAAYHTLMNGDISLKNAVGFALAILAALFLNDK